MDRNDRRHLPGFHEMIERGRMHAMYGGPDEIDAAPAQTQRVLRPKEPVGGVFGFIKPREPTKTVLGNIQPAPFHKVKDEKQFPSSVPMMYDEVDTDCAPVTVLSQGPASRGLTNIRVDPVRAELVAQQWEKQKQSGTTSFGVDSGYGDSVGLSFNTHSFNSGEEANLLSQSAISDNFRNLSLDQENNQKYDPVKIQTISETKSRPTELIRDSDEVVANPLPVLPSDFLSEADKRPVDIHAATAQYQRNLKYFEQDSESQDSNMHHLLYADQDSVVLQLLDDLCSYQFLDIDNVKKQTLIHVATIMNKPHVIRSIMQHGGAVDSRDYKGNTPLHIASQKGHLECVETLTTPLNYDEVKNVPYKVPFRCIPQCMEFKNYEGYTCLHLAVLNNHFDLVHHLVHDLGADIDAVEGKRGMTALIMCVEQRNAQMLMYLVQQCKANIHARTYDRKNALELAIGRGYNDIAGLLRSIGAEAEDEDEDFIDEDFDDFTVNGQPVHVSM